MKQSAGEYIARRLGNVGGQNTSQQTAQGGSSAQGAAEFIRQRVSRPRVNETIDREQYASILRQEWQKAQQKAAADSAAAHITASALAAAKPPQLRPKQTAAGTEPSTVDLLVNDYKNQQEAYRVKYNAERELELLNNLQMRGNMPDDEYESRRAALEGKIQSYKNVKKPTRPMIGIEDYANETDTTGKLDDSSRKRTQELLQLMKQEQGYWDEAQKREQPGSRGYSDSEQRYNERYNSYAEEYKKLTGYAAPTGSEWQLSDAKKRLEALGAQLDEMDAANHDRFYNSDPVNDPQYAEYLAQVQEVQNQYDEAKAEVKRLTDAAKNESKSRIESASELQGIEAKTDEELAAAQEELDAATEALADAGTRDEIAAARKRLQEAEDRYDQIKPYSDYFHGVADSRKNDARLNERERETAKYDTLELEPDFEAVAEKAMEPYLSGNASQKEDPVGWELNDWDRNELGYLAGGMTPPKYFYLSENEKKRYYYLLGTSGRSAAMEYLDDMDVTLDKRRTELANANTEIAYGTSGVVGKVGLNAMTVPAQLVGNVSAPISDLISAASGEYNPYSIGHAPMNFSNTIRTETAQDIMNSIDDPTWGKIGANTYQALMSAADSAAGAMLFGAGYTWMMGGGAASQRAQELYEKGASDVEIGLGAVGAGLIEVLTENYSIESFTEKFLKGNVTGFADGLKKTLIQGLNEGSEEVASDLLNLVLDAMVETSNSDYRQAVNAMIANGMTPEEAEKQAFLNQAEDTFWSFYGGAVSGGFMGGIGTAVNAATSDARKTGKALFESGEYSEIIDTAQELRPKDKTAQVLKSRDSKGKIGKRGSDFAKITNLYQQNIADLTNRDIENVKSAVQQKAEAMGVKESSAAHIAEGVVKQLTGEKPSMTERYAMAQNKSVAETLLGDIRDSNTPGKRTDSNAWVREIGAYTLDPRGFGSRQTETQTAARSSVMGQLQEAADSIFGQEHAKAIGMVYQPGQNRGTYVAEMTKAYKAGQNGTALDAVEGLSTVTKAQAQLAYNLGKNSVSADSYAYDADAQGQSYVASTNAPVNISGIAAIRGGSVILNTDEGSTVSASDVKFGDYGTARLYRTIADMGVSANTGNVILDAAKESSLGSSAFAVAVRDAYDAGRNGVAIDNLGRDSNAMQLDEATRRIAWEAGRSSVNEQVESRRKSIDQGKHKKKQGGVTVEDSAKNVTLNEQQKSGMDAAKVLGAMGIDVTVYASTEAERKAGMENGNISLADGGIRVDLNAGVDGQGVMAFALSHEFTHFVEEMSPAKFRAFTDILFSESGIENVSEMISAKAAQLKEMDAYKGLDENTLNDIAYSEVTAEMMETALTDTDVLSRISSRLQQTDKSLWGKIKDFLKGLVDRLKAAYQEMNPDSSIARLARQSIRSSENALNAFADAASDAIVNYNLQDGGTVSAESAVNTASTVNTASSAVNTVESITKAEGGVDTASSAANTTESIARAESTAEVQKNAAQENAEQSVKRTEYGEFVAAVSDDILKNTDPARWSGVDKEHAIIAAKEALAKFGEIVVYDITDEQFGNICQVSTEQMRSGKLLPLTSSNYKAVAIGNVLMGAGKNQYSVSVYVGKTQTGDNVFCGVRDIKPTQFTVTEGRRRAAATEISGKLQDGQKNSAQEGVRYSLRGTNKNGIEVYETSDEVKALSWKERKAQYLDIMRNEYAGRTAKFTRNGHDYYAQFDSSSLRKPIYGDNRSTQKGVRALANAGADGDFFTLVENSQYRGSKPNGKDHTGADYFDYFVKTVQIDGNVFDLVADVERNYYVKGGYIYTLALRDNKKMEASPAHSIQDAGKGAGNASYVGTVSQQDADVKQNMRYSSRTDSTGRKLSKGQAEYFANSEVRDEDGNLKVVYHGSPSVFTEFSADFLGTHGSSEGQGFYFTDYKPMAEGYQRDGGQLLEGYLNIQNPLSDGEVTMSRAEVKRLLLNLDPTGDDLVLNYDSRGGMGYPSRSWYNRAVNDTLNAVMENSSDSEILAELGNAMGDYSAVLEKAKSVLGYDGYIVPGKYDNATVYVAFDSSQFKNADNLNPTGAKDIRFSQRQSREVKQALDDYRYQRDVEFKAMKAVYDAERSQIEQAHRREMQALEDSYQGDTATMSREFVRLLREYDKQGLSREKLEQKLLDAKKDNATWEREFKRLLREYDGDIDRLENKLKTQQQNAKAKVENARKIEERQKLERVISDINRRLLSPTKTLYVPDSLQPAVTTAMQSIATIQQQGAAETARRVTERYEELLAKLRKNPVKNAAAIEETQARLANILARQKATVQNALERMQDAYAELTRVNQGVFTQEYNEGIMGFIQDAKDAIGETSYGDLSIEQLQTVRDAYTSILKAIRDANRMHGKNLREGYAQTAKAALGEFREQKSKNPALGALKKETEKLSWNNEKPFYAFQRLGNNTMMTLYENMRDGEDGWYNDFSEARAYMLGTMDKYHYDRWENNLVEVATEDGGTVALDLQERMSLYAAARRDQAVEHLTGDGFILKGSKRGGKDYSDYTSHILSQEAVMEIRSGGLLELTQEQIDFANDMQAYLSTVCAEKNNEISRTLYGVSKAKEQYYWPLRSSGVRSDRVRSSQEFTGNRQKNAGHMKATTKHASNAIELSGFMNTWADHVNDTAMYHNFTLPMEDFYRVYNYKSDTDSLRQQILRTHGEAATGYIDTLLKDINGGVRADNRESAFNMLLTGFKKGAVSASLSVAIQQPSAIGRAFSIIDAKYFIGMKVDGVRGINNTWEEMKQYAPVVGLKDIGRFDTDMGRSTREMLSGKNEKGVKAALDTLSGWLPEQMDKVTWCAIWEASKRQVKAQDSSLSGDALKARAGKLFTQCITQTQVYDSVFSRSGNMRSKSMYMKMLTSFMAEPTTTINMVESAARDIMSGNRKAGAKKLASVGTALVLNSLLASIIYAARDDDEEKTWAEKYLSSLTSELVDGLNPITYYPGLKDVWSIFQGYDVERSDMSLISAMTKTTNKAAKAWRKYVETDPEDEEGRKGNLREFGIASLDAAAGIANLFGIPAKNVLRELWAVKNTYETVTGGRKSDSYTRGRAIWDGVVENIPSLFRTTESKTDRLYKAILAGSDAELDRLKSSYDTDKKYESAIATALSGNDSRIRQAAKSKVSGDAQGAEKLLGEIEKEGHFTRDQIDKAFEKQMAKIPGGTKTSVKEQYVSGETDQSSAVKQLTTVMGMEQEDAETEVRKWGSVAQTGIEYADIQDEYLNGGLTESKAAEMLVKYGGKTSDAAKELVKQWGCEKDLGIAYSDIKTAYQKGKLTDAQLKTALTRYGGKSAQDAEQILTVCKFKKQNPTSDLTDGQIESYLREIDGYGKSAQDAGIRPAVYAEYKNRLAQCKGTDADGDGKTDSGSKKSEVLAMIDSLDISDSQKDALYYASGYASSGLRRTPWHAG